MNVKLLRKIEEHILAEPKRLDMNFFVHKEGLKGNGLYEKGLLDAARYPACGTMGCIAGWAKLLSTPELISLDVKLPLARQKFMEEFRSGGRTIEAIAADLLEISATQAGRLFYVESWPEEFEEQYNAAEERDNLLEAAATTVARMEWFIETNGSDGIKARL